VDDHTIEDREYQLATWMIIDDVPDDKIWKYWVNEKQECLVLYLRDEAEKITEFVPDCKTEKMGLVLTVDNYHGTILKQVLLAEVDAMKACECTAAPTDSPPAAAPVTYSGGGAKDQPTDEPRSGVNGDPHFKTWSEEKYDFHGICDLVLLSNPTFQKGLGMDVHVRSKKTRQWSYISTAVIRIGSETFEVSGRKDGDLYRLNGMEGPHKFDNESTSIEGFPIRFKHMSKAQREYTISLNANERIVVRTWKDFVRVDIVDADSIDFKDSLGLMGSYPEGNRLGRDGVTVMKDWNDFGQEWQVITSDPKIFTVIEGPQYPMQRCEVPTKSVLRRKLAKSTMTREDADLACSHAVHDDRDLCIFDVMATNDIGAARIY